MKLLERHGVHLQSAKQFLVTAGSGCSIADEARLALTTVQTLAGAKLIANQVERGLSFKVRQWKQRLSLDGIAEEAKQILRDSAIARLLIEGCAVALIGPAGAGKSTLLNTLAGREKAIVTGIKGTTRDWVSAEIHLPPLAVTLIDTAGFVSLDDGIDQTAQAKSLEILDRADVVLLVLDITESAGQIDPVLREKLATKKVVPVLNKSDLPETLEINALPDFAHAPIRVSVKQGTGVKELTAAIIEAAGVANLDSQAPVAFTRHQRDLLEQLSATSSCADAVALVDERA